MNELFHQLGASLYIPATNKDLALIASGQKYTNLKSMIFCTEDSIIEQELELALNNITESLDLIQPNNSLKFIRVRNLEVLKYLITQKNIEKIHGFVLPKITTQNINDYFYILDKAQKPFYIMPTLETKEVFCNEEMKDLRKIFLHEKFKERILAIRIGGNDLLNTLGLKRPTNHTIYETPIGNIISNLILIFKPFGFNLTAPVFEYLDNNEILQAEVKRDLINGLFSKSSIHPCQIDIIENLYKVEISDLKMAESILFNKGKQAVFKMNESMCEIATHYNWAKSIIERSKIHGIANNLIPV